ncbi:MAG: DUF1816 domain-containing protein [Nostocaceae cyanobacterium]|nr:DUF1816 domain-containing protein [Nostocaceae cyanobacterium]
MTFSEIVEATFLSFLEELRLAWWVEIITNKPQCTYYFGPFACFKEAELALPGYIEDLEDEAALGIAAEIKRYQPKDLTIFDDESKPAGVEPQCANAEHSRTWHTRGICLFNSTQ